MSKIDSSDRFLHPEKYPPRPLSTSPFHRTIAIATFCLTSYFCYQWCDIFIPSIFSGFFCLWLVSCILRLTWMEPLTSFMIFLVIVCILFSPFKQHDRDKDYDFEPRHMEKR